MFRTNKRKKPVAKVAQGTDQEAGTVVLEDEDD